MWQRLKFFLKFFWYTYKLAALTGFLGKEKLGPISPEASLHFSSHEKRKLAALQNHMKKGPVTFPLVLNLQAHLLMKAQNESDLKLVKRRLEELNHLTRYWLARL